MAETEAPAVEQEQTQAVEQPAVDTTAPATSETTVEKVVEQAAAPITEAAKPKYLGQFDTPEHAAMYYKGKSEAAAQPAKSAETAKPQYTQ